MTHRELRYGHQHHHGHGRPARRSAVPVDAGEQIAEVSAGQLFLEMMLDPGKLEDFRVRDFSPTLQGWVEQEPLGYLDGLNAYAFVNDESAQPVPRMNDGACGTRCAGGTKCLTLRKRGKLMAYSPTMMRFGQQDPMGYVDGLNDYQAVGDSPIKRRDPNGMSWIGDAAKFGAGVTAWTLAPGAMLLMSLGGCSRKPAPPPPVGKWVVFSDSRWGAPGYVVGYQPDAPAAAGKRIVLVQAIGGGGITGVNPHIDINPSVGTWWADVQNAHTSKGSSGINPPGYIETGGVSEAILGYSMGYFDRPAGRAPFSATGNLIDTISAVAIERSTPGVLNQRNTAASDRILGAINFTFNESTGAITADSGTVLTVKTPKPAGLPTTAFGPIYVSDGGATGSAWTTAMDRWNDSAGNPRASYP